MANTPGSLPKSQGDIIYGADYNAVQTKIRGVLGDGNGYASDYGYGQSLSSSAVAADSVINHTQWGYLFSDIDKAYTHQTNVAYSEVNPSAGLSISLICSIAKRGSPASLALIILTTELETARTFSFSSLLRFAKASMK